MFDWVLNTALLWASTISQSINNPDKPKVHGSFYSGVLFTDFERVFISCYIVIIRKAFDFKLLIDKFSMYFWQNNVDEGVNCNSDVTETVEVLVRLYSSRK